MATATVPTSPPDPYRIVNGRLCRGQTDIVSVARYDDALQEFMLELLNIAYQVGHVHGEQAEVQRQLNRLKGVTR